MPIANENITTNNIENIRDEVNKLAENLYYFKQNSAKLQNHINIFNNKPQDNLPTLLTYYKNLELIKNLYHQSETLVNFNQNKIINICQKLKSGFIFISYISLALILKNMTKGLSIFLVDDRGHDFNDLINSTLLNKQNYLVSGIDTLINAFFISHLGKWVFKTLTFKNDNNNSYKLPPICFATLNNYEKLIKRILKNEYNNVSEIEMEKIKIVNNFMNIFRQINNDNSSENVFWQNNINHFNNFTYKSFFTSEVNTLLEWISKGTTPTFTTSNVHTNIVGVANSANHVINEEEWFSNDDDIKLKEIIKMANNIVVQLELEVKNNNNEQLTCLLFTKDMLIEIILATISHIIITGASENTNKLDFTISGWITEDIFKPLALVSTITRYISIRPINILFNSGLNTINWSSSAIWDKISGYLENMSMWKKAMLAVITLGTITVVNNTIKTFAALMFEYADINQAFNELLVILDRPQSYMFFLTVTAIDALTFYFSPPKSRSIITKIWNRAKDTVSSSWQWLTGCEEIAASTLWEQKITELAEQKKFDIGMLPAINDNSTNIDFSDTGIKVEPIAGISYPQNLAAVVDFPRTPYTSTSSINEQNANNNYPQNLAAIVEVPESSYAPTNDTYSLLSNISV